MRKENTYRLIFWLSLLFLSILISHSTYATHAQSADITYQCIGGNQYQVSVSFYRDCAGVSAPNTIDINTSSASCGLSFNTTISQVPGTGIDMTPICNTQTTTCNGGANPGVEEYIYSGIIPLPTVCNDWTFSFSLCCRNNAINTINNPGGENIYVEAKLNNLDFACNNSPTFSNPPVAFPCVGQISCFNHGAIDVDGDSLYYSLITPATSPTTTVTYLAGYSAQQPLNSNPATTFNSTTGDICMTPVIQEVTVLAVKVEEFRNEIFVGSVIRDIQLRTVTCTNNLPYLTGINGTGQYSITACAGSPLNFNIPSFDIDAGQTVTLNWNNAIPSASFTDNGAQLPTANFNWTPTIADISTIPYCFTVTVSDDNCPFNGVQIYSFCITVTGFTTTTTSTSANCGASNGSATATVQGGTAPYSYQWIPNGGNNANANGLLAGQYTVIVTDASGCVSSSTTTVGTGPLPGNINIASNNVSCFGGNDGSATANVNGGGQPYVYLWSNGGFNQTISNLTSGTYYVTVTSNGGCVTTDTIVITQPSSPVTATTTQINVSCFGSNDGSASVIPSGGTPPYSAIWNTNPVQNNLNASNLSSGNYSVLVTDNNGCNTSQSITINSPQALSFNLLNQQNVSCFGGNNGAISINVNGGTAPYSYNWNNNTFPNSASINNLNAGVYLLSITDDAGCTAINQYTITEPNVLNSSVINYTDISCNGFNDGTIQTNTTGGTPPYSYQWNTSLSTSFNVTGLSYGNHIVTVTDINGCIDTTAAFINEPSTIATTVLGADTICPGQTATLIASASGGTGNYTYQWNNGNIGATQTVSPSSSTTYSVYAIDVNGCVGTTDSANVLVNDIYLVDLFVVPDTSLCEGSPYLISANVSGGIGSYSFSWNNGLGQGQGPFVVAPTYTTNYMVIVTDDCGNSINESVLVNVNPLPVINIQPQTETGCGSVKLNLSNNNGNLPGATFYWDFGDGTNSYQETPNKTYTQTGIYNVILTITSTEGCQNSNQANMNVKVNPQSVAQFEFNPNETDILNPEITFENYSIDATFYTWDFGDGETSNQTNPIHSYKNDGTYYITLITSNAFGCKDTATDKLVIEPKYNFYIPNAFTPNNDGDNDIFTAIGEEIKEFNMQIFNRWGELIYETSNIEKGWDGTTKDGSSIFMTAVYVYNIKIKDWQDLNHKYIGKVTLVK
jgi:gliding motility-associated-like protein